MQKLKGLLSEESITAQSYELFAPLQHFKQLYGCCKCITSASTCTGYLAGANPSSPIGKAGVLLGVGENIPLP